MTFFAACHGSSSFPCPATAFDDEEPTDVLGALGTLVSTPISIVQPDTPISEVLKLLVELRIPAVAVVDRCGAIGGIVTRTDVLRELARGDHASAGDAMSGFVFALSARSTVERAAALMAYEGVGQVVVTGSRGELVGMVSALDIARYFAVSAGYLAQ
jgi:CBS domain-containing protein